MKIFARADLAPSTLAQNETALLLEGSWPSNEPSATRWSLDDAVDARCAWIDREASRLAELAAHLYRETSVGLFAWLNALTLRYELVKLVRLIAFFEQCYRPQRHETLELHLERQRDEPYALLFRELSRSHRLPRVERWHAGQPASPPEFPANRRWRRTVARVVHAPALQFVAHDRTEPRVVLCGNPRILDPVCKQLLRGGARVWWLYDRFAVRSFARWRMRGVRQLVCDADLSGANCFDELQLDARLACRGIDLGGAVTRWLTNRAMTHGARQTRLLAEVERQLRAVQPDALVCDEDATPLPRVAIHVSRPFGTQSYVVQHGAPCIRFGFSPPAADRLLVWGDASQRQLARWGVDRDRITITGAPYREDAVIVPPSTPRAKGSSAHIVLLATVPPRDSRPDSVEYHLTRRTHTEMLAAACRAVSQVPNASLTIKLHPRSSNEVDIKQVLASFPGLTVSVVRRGNLSRLVRGAACVLSCASSAGVEAAACGVPVIQLLPIGSIDLLPTEEWGFLGTARNAAELTLLLSAALSGARPCPANPVFAASGRIAAQRIVQAVFSSLPKQDEWLTDDAPAGALTMAGATTWPSN